MDASIDHLPPFAKMSDGMLHLRQDGTIISADEALCRFIGMEADELRDRTWVSLFHPFDSEDIYSAIQRMRQLGEAHVSMRGFSKDSSVSQLYAHLCYPETDKQNTGDYYCFILNLDTRINYNSDKLHFERLFAISTDLLCIANTMGYFLKVNPAFTRTLGYSQEELQRTSFLEFIHPDDVESTVQEMRKLRSGIDTACFENRYRCKHGGWRWLAWSTPAPDEEGILYAVAKDITERKQFEEQLLRLAKFDFLTGLPNRAYLDEELKRAMARMTRSKRVLAGFLIDIDGLRQINETFGQSVGDDLLRHVAIRLRNLTRASDFLARIGASELFLVAEFEDETAARALEQKISASMTEPFILDLKEMHAAFTIGIAICRGNAKADSHAFVSQAGHALRESRIVSPGEPAAVPPGN